MVYNNVDVKSAWPFLVGGVICLVNSDNERDLILLNRRRGPRGRVSVFLEGLSVTNRWKKGNNRSVMPLDVLGRTRATLTKPASLLDRKVWVIL